MPPAVYTPLVEPPFPVKPPSWFERACMFVPLLGWLIAAHLDWRRREPKAVSISEQILARGEPAWEAWGDDAERRAIAAVVCEEIQKEFGWLNPHYLPDDPLALLLWGLWPDTGLLFAVVEAERRLGAGLWPRHFDYANGTLGQLVDTIVKTQKIYTRLVQDRHSVQTPPVAAGSGEGSTNQGV